MNRAEDYSWICRFNRYFLSVVPVAVVALLGRLVTEANLPWYDTLYLPEWTPPSSVFGPVWTFLYMAMAYAQWRILRPAWTTSFSLTRRRRVAKAAVSFLIQLAVNLLWSIVFFGGRHLFGGVLVLILLLYTIYVTIYRFGRVDIGAALLLIPYFIWVSYALVLNVAIWARQPHSPF